MNGYSATTVFCRSFLANNWTDVRCYAYTDGGEEPNGKWASATKMTSEGNGWFVCTVPAISAYVMFHPTSGSAQEPGSGEQGYPVAGEAWIQNKTVTFSSKVITSHVDVATGKKIADDVIDNQAKTTSASSYTTSALSGRTDVITPSNAQGKYSAGIVNVVYLYTSSQPITTAPPATTQPATTAPPSGKVLIGDADDNGVISVADASTIQKYLADLVVFSDRQIIAGDCDGDGTVGIKDATLIQRYCAEYSNTGNIGQYVGGTEETTAPVTTQPTTAPPTTQPTTAPQTTVPTPETYTVKFSNSQRWSGTIYCYYWTDGEDASVAWPGTPMEFVENNNYGEAVYSVEVPSDADFIIFNNNDSQTVDIPFDGTALNFYAKSEIDESWHHLYGTW